MVYSAELISNSSEITIFLLLDNEYGYGAAYRKSFFTGNNSSWGIMFSEGPGGENYMYSMNNYHSVNTAVSSGKRLFSYRLGNNKSEYYIDNELGTSLTLSHTLTNLSPVQLGWGYGSEFFIGQIAEVMVFDYALSDTNMAEINYYLSGKWGLDPNFDSDGDGFIDSVEQEAGTNPKDKNLFPQPTITGSAGTGETYTFNNCGATGRFGPTSTAGCDSSVKSSITLSYGVQQWTVPSTGTYQIEVWGAKGGSGSNSHSLSNNYGKGAYVSAEFSLNSGDTLNVLVGQKGESTTSDSAGGAGGGGTYVWINGSNEPLIVAGGGAGGGDNTINSIVHNNAYCGQVKLDGHPNEPLIGVSSCNNSQTASSAGYGGKSGGSPWAGGGGGGWYGDGVTESNYGKGGAGLNSGSLQPGIGIGADVYDTGYPAKGGFGGGGGTGYDGGGGGGGYTGGIGGTYTLSQASGGGSYIHSSGTSPIRTKGGNTEDHGKVSLLLLETSDSNDSDGDGFIDSVEDAHSTDSLDPNDIPDIPQIVTQAVLWLDSNNIDGQGNEGLNNGDYITNWVDLSGNGNDLVKTSVGTITYDSTDPKLSFEFSGMKSVTNFENQSVYIVHKTINNQTYFLDLRDNSHSYEAYVYNWGNNHETGTWFDSLVVNGESKQRNSINKFDVTDTIFNAKKQITNLTGSSVLNTSFDLSQRFTEEEHSKGEFYEILVFSSKLTTENHIEVQSYLADKWDLTDTVDSDGDGFVDSLELDLNNDGDFDDDGESDPTDMYSTPVPEIIGSAALWLDASNINGNRNEGLNNGDYITNWVDLSGNGNDAIQSNISYAPRLTDQNFNSKSSIMFDGINDFLELSRKPDLTKNEATVIILARQDTSDNSSSALYFDLGATYFFGISSSKPYLYFSGSPTKYSSVTPRKGDFHYFVYQFKRGNEGFLKLINETWNVDTINTVIGSHQLGSNTNHYIGRSGPYGSSKLDGQISEIIIFESIIEDNQISKIYNYLAKKWGLEDSVDSDNDGFKDIFEQDLNDDGDFLDENESNPMDDNSVPFHRKLLDSVLWFDASNQSSIIETNGAVSEWRDLSQSMKHLKQNISGSRPNYDSLNKQVSFDNKSLNMKEYTRMKLFFVVHKTESIGKYLFALNSTTHVSDLGYGLSTKFNDYWRNGNEQSKTINNNTKFDESLVFTNERQLSVFSLSNSSNYYFYLNERYNSYEKGKTEINEIIVFDADLTYQERKEITYYLSKKWGLDSVIDSDEDGFVDSMEDEPVNELLPLDSDSDYVPDQIDSIFPTDNSKVISISSEAPEISSSNILLWLDTSNSRGVDIDQFGNVRQLFDLSGNQHHAQQPFIENRPLYNSETNNIQFSTNKYLKTKTELPMGAKTMFIVAEGVGDLVGNSSYVNKFNIEVSDAAAISVGIGGSQISQINHSNNIGTSKDLVILQDKGANRYDLYINGVLVKQNQTYFGATSDASGNYFQIGRIGDLTANYFNGTIDEIIIYDRVLTVDEINKIQDYMSLKWQLNRKVRNVFVDESTTNSKQLGTYLNPFKYIDHGFQYLVDYGKMNLKSAVYTGKMVFKKPTLLTAVNGTVVLGGLPAGQHSQTESYVFVSTKHVQVISTDQGNKFQIDESLNAFEIKKGQTIRFDQSDPSNLYHPIRFSITEDGTHNDGSPIVTQTYGTPGYPGAYTEITISEVGTLYFYCGKPSRYGKSNFNYRLINR